MNNELRAYLLEHPIDRNKNNPYDEVAKKFNVDKEYVRNIWRKLRYKGLVEKDKETDKSKQLYPLKPEECYKVTGETAQIKKSTDKDIKNEKDLAEDCNIDLTKWEITSWEVKRYFGWIKNADGSIEEKPFYSVYASLKKKHITTDLVLQKEFILDEIKNYVQSKVSFKQKEYSPTGSLLLELALFDVHFGKLSHADESGEDYDLKIAGQRYKDAIDDLLSKVEVEGISKILFPIGNDMFNVDNVLKTTTNGTPQDTDTRFHKMVKFVVNILTDTITYLSNIAPVDVVVVQGNHDMTMSYMCGEILNAYYHANTNVNIDNSPKLRKYYVFGQNSFMFTHGDREKQSDLGIIFASEQPKIWGNSTFRFCQIGHFHHTKKIQYLTANEFQGFQVQILPSLSPNDAWHTGKGYSALRQAKAFLYDENDGLVAELTHTAKKHD